MSYLDWKVGDKVVCVDAEWPLRWGVCPLREGGIYTILRVARESGGYRGELDPICVRLAEVDYPFGRDEGFAAARFRPIQKRSTDISIFTRILTNPNLRIEEDA